MSESAPQRLELVPGKFALLVESIVVPRVTGATVRCWSLRTEGLRQCNGAAEMAMLVEQEGAAAAGAFPRDVAGFLASFYSHATNGQLIGIGDFMMLNESAPRLLGRFAGAVCAPMSTDILPASYLLLVLLTAHEIEVGRRFGAQRIISTLGAQCRRFPTVPWAQRERAEIPLGDGTEHTSLLARVPVGRPPRLYAALVSDGIVALPVDRSAVPGDTQVTGFVRAELVVSLDADGHAWCRAELAGWDAERGGVVLMASPDPQARAAFAWQPGATTVIGYQGHGGRLIAASFVGLMPDASARPYARQAEDGFILVAPPPTLRAVRDALVSGTTFTVPLQGDIGALHVQNRALAAGGFRSHALVMYVDEATTQARIAGVERLMAFIRQVEGLCADHFTGDARPRALDVVLLFRPPHRLRVWFVPEPDAAERARFEALADAIMAVAAPAVSGPLAIALRGTIAGFERPIDPKAFQPPLPDAWRAALERRGTARVPDDILADVWPDEH
jgi:hypothetical protein